MESLLLLSAALGLLGIAVHGAPPELPARPVVAVAAPYDPYAAPQPQVVYQVMPTPVPTPDPFERGLTLGGPRLGMTLMDDQSIIKLDQALAREGKPGVDRWVSQFGWEIEYRFFKTRKGLTAIADFIPLIGGLEQGMALPSANLLCGFRLRNGIEFGAGPNLSMGGTSLMVGTGYTFRLDGINVPINTAVGFGKDSRSYSFSVGFNL